MLKIFKITYLLTYTITAGKSNEFRPSLIIGYIMHLHWFLAENYTSN